jgi:hypothetical protein
MISFYFSPHRSVQEWDKQKFIDLIHSVQPLRHYIGKRSTLFGRDLGVSLRDAVLLQRRPLAADIDFLIRFEHLESDFAHVCNTLDIPCSKLPKRNSSQRLPYSTYYDSELKDLVFRKFSEEINFGNYAF